MSRWSRRELLQSVAAAASLAGCTRGGGVKIPGQPISTGDTGQPTTGARPPNVLYLYSDQHRAPILGPNGHPWVQTPNLDALAARAVTFGASFTNGTLCRPARATMMTGLLPHAHGCWTNDQVADPLGPSHVRRFRDEAGYLTALIGKSHLTVIDGHPADPANLAGMTDWGFESAFEMLSQIVCATKPNFYSDWLAETTPKGELSKAVRYARYVQEWVELGFPPPDAAPYLLATEDHVDIWCGDLAAEWIRGYADERPFYLQVNFPGPHSPYDATTEFRSLYDASAPGFPTAILGPPQPPLSRILEFLHAERPELHGLTAADSQGLLLTYFAKVTLIDRAVGAVLAALEERGLSDNTWVIYGSDHGDLLGDHELWGKVAFYEGSIRTPLLVRPPGGVPPWMVQSKIDQQDVTATLLEIAGLVPDGTGSGRLAQIVGGPEGPLAQSGRDTVIAEVAAHWDGSLRTGMIRDDRFKLVYDYELEEPAEFYDLEADPNEIVNRVFDPKLATQRSALRDELQATVDGS